MNGYPGPAHVLELADQLGLSTDQKARIQSLFDSMKAEALSLGAKLLSEEAALDQQFASLGDHRNTEGCDGADRGNAS